MSMPKAKSGKYYAVRQGREIGVFRTWEECQKRVQGYPEARYKKFTTEKAALDFIGTSGLKSGGEKVVGEVTVPPGPSPTPARWFYAVARGHTPGIYYDWVSCSNQVKGFGQARYKKFKTLDEALSFIVTEGNRKDTSVTTTINTTTAKSVKPENLPETDGDPSPNMMGHQKPYPKLSHNELTFQVANHVRGAAMVSHEDCHGNTKPNDDTPSPHYHVVYCDGSCKNQQSRTARRAGVGVFWGQGDDRNLTLRMWGEQTNQRAELWAAILALNTALATGIRYLEIRTDSWYTIQGITNWIKKWEVNGFTDSTGKAVTNKDLFRCLRVMVGLIGFVRWTHVRAHRGEPGNEAADELAKTGAALEYPEGCDGVIEGLF